MKHKLFIIVILLTLGLAGCANTDKINLPHDTLPGDFMLDETTTSDDSASAGSVTEPVEKKQLYSDESVTLTLAGTQLYCEYNGTKVMYPLPESLTISSATRLKRLATSYIILNSEKGTLYCFTIESNSSFTSLYEYQKTAEFNGTDFYFSEAKKETLALKDDQISGVFSNKKYYAPDFSSGKMLICYSIAANGKPLYNSISPQLCDSETFEPVSSKNFFVAASEKYIVTHENYHYLLYSSNFELLFDWGTVPYEFSVGSVTLDEDVSIEFGYSSYIPVTLRYPADDLGSGESVYKNDSFDLRQDGDKWYIHPSGANYLIDCPISSDSAPEIGRVIGEYDENVVYIYWSGAKKILRASLDVNCFEVFDAQDEKESIEWKGNKIVTDSGNSKLVFDRNGKFTFYFDDYMVCKPRGNFLAIYSDIGNGLYQTVYDKNLQPISNALITPCFLSDGTIVAVSSETSKNFLIFDSDGKLTKTSRDYDQVLMSVCAESVTNSVPLILVNDGGKLQLVDKDEKVVAEFDEYSPDWTFHIMLSGYNEKTGTTDAPPAYYFVFEDDSKTDEEGNYRSVEYWYAPETGKTGEYDYYSSFAYAKPVLYLYPEKETNVSVKFAHPERLTTVYPDYNDGWSVKASPDGNLFDGKRNYYALYWEENSDFAPDFSTGFIIEDNYSEFLEEKLDEIGLTEREANEFIMYWLPILEKNGKSIVHFELTESREAGNKLLISPEPDSLLRIAIHIKKAGSVESVTPQTFEKFERKGFTAVEWGGRIYDTIG